MRLRNVKNKEEIMNNSNYLVKNYYDYKGKWRELFNNDNPIYIEIGMGKGKFIIENAVSKPSFISLYGRINALFCVINRYIQSLAR